MIAVLADTSALVSLEIRHIVAMASTFIQFSIPTGVFEELKEIAQFDDVHGRSAKDVLNLVEDGIITVQSVRADQKHNENIDLGEAEVLTLAESGVYEYIITVDFSCLMRRMEGLASINMAAPWLTGYYGQIYVLEPKHGNTDAEL